MGGDNDESNDRLSRKGLNFVLKSPVRLSVLQHSCCSDLGEAALARLGEQNMGHVQAEWWLDAGIGQDNRASTIDIRRPR